MILGNSGNGYSLIPTPLLLKAVSHVHRKHLQKKVYYNTFNKNEKQIVIVPVRTEEETANRLKLENFMEGFPRDYLVQVYCKETMRDSLAA